MFGSPADLGPRAGTDFDYPDHYRTSASSGRRGTRLRAPRPSTLTSRNLSIKMIRMRTTLTLDPDVARLLREQMRREHRPFKEVVNAALRQALAPGGAGTSREPYQVTPHEARLVPGYDLRAFNRLADELEDAAILERASATA